VAVAGFRSLQGRLLVAAPSLLDPRFHRTVVLLAEHTREAAMGVVLNRPSDLLAAEVVPLLTDVVTDSEPLYSGGPVQPQSVLALAEFTDPAAAAAIAFDHVGFVAADRPADEIAAETRRLRVFCGYAGWGPGQLEGELSEEAWFLGRADAGDVFSPAAAGLWSAVLDRMGGRFRLIARMPDDPSVN